MGHKASAHPVTPTPVRAGTSEFMASVTIASPRTATRMPCSSATATAKAGNVVTVVPVADAKLSTNPLTPRERKASAMVRESTPARSVTSALALGVTIANHAPGTYVVTNAPHCVRGAPCRRRPHRERETRKSHRQPQR